MGGGGGGGTDCDSLYKSWTCQKMNAHILVTVTHITHVEAATDPYISFRVVEKLEMCNSKLL